jgi:hypothetical protein
VRTARLRAAVALSAVLFLAAVAAPGHPALAAGATISETGWWSRSPGTATPAGGFEVAKSLEGDLSVAALKVQVEGTVTSALVVLVEAPGGVNAESGVIEACPTTGDWKAAAPGALEDAPPAQCDQGKVALTRNGGAGTWTGDLAPLLARGGTVGILLKPGVATAVVAPTPPTTPAGPVPTPVPVPTVPAPVDPGFTVELSRADLIVSATDDASSSSSGPTPTAGSGTGAIASGGSSGSGFDSTLYAPTFSGVDSGAFAAVPSVTPQPDALPAATADVAPTGAGGAGTAARVENGLQPVASHRGEPPPWGRLLLIVPLSAAIGAAGSAARRRLVPLAGG